MTEKNSRFPGAFEALLLVVGLTAVEILLTLTVHELSDGLQANEQDMAGVIQVLANGLLFTFVMHHKGLSYRQLFHSSLASPKATFFVLLPPILLILPALVLVMCLILNVLAGIWPLSASDEAMFERMGSGSVPSIVLVCLLAPVLEEMLFRGVILRSFLQQYSRWSAILGSATLFGLAHLNLYQFAVGVILGTISGWLYDRSRSLLPCIALHGGYNSAIMMLWMADASASGLLADPTPILPWLAALPLAGAGLYLLRRVLPRPV